MTPKMLAADRAPLGHLTGTPEALRLDPSVSPLVLCDRLLTLAKDVDRAGLRDVAECLIELAGEVLRPARPCRSGRQQHNA